MKTTNAVAPRVPRTDPYEFDLYVRGEIPRTLEGSLILATSRRDKRHGSFFWWHDSAADLIRLDLFAGKPGRISAKVLPVDPSGEGLDDGFGRPIAAPNLPVTAPFENGYATQPNHATNTANGTVWATNLLFGAPLEVNFSTWRPQRVLRYLDPSPETPRTSTTAHFAWSLDGKAAYFHQSLLDRGGSNGPVISHNLRLIEFDLQTGESKSWAILPPPEDSPPERSNFHSAFFFEMHGKAHVGLLRTGAIVPSLPPLATGMEHSPPLPTAAVWVIPVDHTKRDLQASLLPGLGTHKGVALSHLAVDASSRNGFILYANCKQANVGRETVGKNVYGQLPNRVTEHYAGMVVEAFGCGSLIRYELWDDGYSIRTLERSYDPSRTSLGHTWLPINIELDRTRERLFCTFSGFRPRLLSMHSLPHGQANAPTYETLRYIPPLLMRLDAVTLEPDYDSRRSYLSYAEPMAMALAGPPEAEHVCTFSPETGLRIYDAHDLNNMICHAVAEPLKRWQDSHFRPEPAHLEFLPR